MKREDEANPDLVNGVCTEVSEALKSTIALSSIVFPSLRRKIIHAPIPVLVTGRCNSPCRKCSVWENERETDLDVEIIRDLLSDRTVGKYTSFILTGGEFLLHPQYKDILSMFEGRRYALISNGLLSDKLVEAIREFKVKRLYLSLDGPVETCRRFRGLDEHSKIENLVTEIKNEVDLFIMYTVTPWNTRKDLDEILQFCKRYSLHVLVGYYQDSECSEARVVRRMYSAADKIDHPYHRLYDYWASGKLRMPCLSILMTPVVMPNGDVRLCIAKEIVLGNLHKRGLGDIWTSKETRAIQRKYVGCNSCWADGHRYYDLRLISSLRTLLPNCLLNKVLGKSDWNKM